MRCEGWTRKGGIFTMGIPQWSQCKNNAVVMLKVDQDEGIVSEQPAYINCWEKGKKANIKILSVEPIKEVIK